MKMGKYLENKVGMIRKTMMHIRKCQSIRLLLGLVDINFLTNDFEDHSDKV